ncbi:transposase [Natronobacterium lacisalsi]|uniref:transposase n=1 Tax=Natronobacterium lacisalsi TaxID=229731 RepID=UPI000B1AF594|nr:transposase [Halobiforma lacisalsi]
MAKEKDEDADRDPESKGEIHERWERKGEISSRYTEAKSKLPDDPRTDPWAYTGLLSRNPAKNITPPLWEAIKSEAYRVYRWSVERDRYDGLESPEHRLAKALGKVQLRHYYWSKGTNENLTENLDGEDATRLYLFFDLSALNQSGVARAIKNPDIREALGIENSVSQPTLNRMPGRMDEETRHYYASETETLVRQLQDTKLEHWFRDPTPDTIVTDGEGFPPVQVIARELRSKTFKYLRLKRDSSTEVTKDAALRVLIAAANGNGFVNDAAKNLKYKGFYDDGDIPTGQNLTHHLRKSSRENVVQMFREANERLFEIAARHGYFPDNAEVAIDITDWPFYGDSESSEFIRGTKPGRNYSWAWKYITLALVGTDTPLILVILPVHDKTKTPKYIRRMLRLSRQHLNIGRVYLDAGTEFYNSDTISTITEQGLELVMQGRKSVKTIKHFLNGMARADLRSSYYPYGVGSLDEDSYYAVGLKSDKTVKLRKSDADEPMDDYTYFYTNLHPEEVPPEELGEAYRRRWGIETDFRVIKEEFLAKCGSRNPALRAFYFNFAAHLFNIWTVANILRAEETGESLSEGKQLTAGELMQAIELLVS